MVSTQDFQVMLRPSRVQLRGWLGLHCLVFLVILLAAMPLILSLLLSLGLLLSALRCYWDYRYKKGAFLLKALRCDTAHAWRLQCWHDAESYPASLVSYQATPFGLAMRWKVTLETPQCDSYPAVQSTVASSDGLLFGKAPAKLHMLVTRDQLSEGDYRWLKVLLSHSLRAQ